jgi:anti-sigma factor RsiW
MDADVHAQVQALLPWYVRARLEADERAMVDAHVAQCPRCQGELAWERKLLVARDGDTGDLRDVESDLAMLRARIAVAADPPTRGSATNRPARGSATTRLVRAWRAGPAWMRWALLAQCVVVAALGAALLVEVPLPGQRYRALGASATMPAAGNLIVRFRPDATEQQMRDALRDSNARIVQGPTRTDAYLLTVPAERVGDALMRLRAQPAVLLVESLDGASPP